MLSFSVVGCGACGNKVATDLVRSGYKPEKVHLINSTDKDIENTGLDTIIFGKGNRTLGGCGKERSVGREMLISDLRGDKIDINHIINDDDQAIVLVGATEGGTGSSSIPILARYFHEQKGKNVIVVLFFGFGDDARGMKNSLEICQELSDDFTIIGISNEKFLSQANDNKFKAEKLANELFIEVMRILTGSYNQTGTQVIDDTDLYKAATTPGFMAANTYRFKRTTAEDFHKGFSNFIRSQGFITPSVNPGAKRLAMIFDVPNDEDTVDYNGNDLRSFYGEPFEFFTHKNSDSKEYKISFIASGMKMPTEEIQEIFESYKEKTAKVDKTKDEFFNTIGSMINGIEDDGFDMMGTQKENSRSDSDFFDSFGTKPFQKGVNEADY